MVLKQQIIKHMSQLYKCGGDLMAEFLYTKKGWLPTWKLAEIIVDKTDIYGFVDKKFVVDVLEGSYIKRVVKEKDETRTIYLVTRSGLVEIPYDYKNRKYVLNTGIVLNDLERRKRVGDIYANFRKRYP